MNFRLTGVIFGLVLLLVGGLLVTLLLDGGQAAVPDGLLAPLTRAGVKADDVDTVELVRTQPAEEKLVFVKGANKKWELRQPGPARVDSFAVDGLVRDLFRAAPTRHPELSSPGVHGLDKPTVRVTLAAGDKAATVNVGLTTIGGDRAVTFVTTGQAPDRPLAVKRGDLGGLFRDAARGKDGPAWELAKSLPDFRARRPLGADLGDAAAEATALKLTVGGKELALARGDGGWAFTAPAGWGAADELGESTPGPSAGPFAGVRPLFLALTNLSVGPADYLDKPGDLAQYGLADADANRVRVELAGKEPPADVLLLGKPVEKDGKPQVPTRVYAKFDGDPAVFSVPFDRLDGLKATVANPSPLRNRDLLPATARATTDAIDLEVAGQTAKLRKLDGKWWLFGGPNGPAEAKPGDAETLLATVSKSRLAKDVLAAPDAAAFAPAEVKVVAKFWAGSTPGKSEPGQPPAEPTVKGEPTVLTLGRASGADVLVRRQVGGASADLVVPVALQSQLARSRVSLLDPKPTPFDVTKATKLTISRGADVTEAGRDDKGAWAFAQPAAKKGQPADGIKTQLLLGTLGNPSVVGVASEAPTPDDLKKWGLEPPVLAATAALDGPEKERTVRFGNPAEPGTVYARVQGQPLVLLVRTEAADELAAADLRDRMLFRLDTSAVTKLTVRGYKTDKGPLTYTFEKSGDTWKAVPPTPDGFAPDAGKLLQLLGVLGGTRVEAFLGAGNKPEYGLDPVSNSEALEIGIDRAGGPPLTLVLGAKAGDGLVYAASAALPGEVFTTRVRGSLDPLAARPANFQAVAPPPPAAVPTPATPKK